MALGTSGLVDSRYGVVWVTAIQHGGEVVPMQNGQCRTGSRVKRPSNWIKSVILGHSRRFCRVWPCLVTGQNRKRRATSRALPADHGYDDRISPAFVNQDVAAH